MSYVASFSYNGGPLRSVWVRADVPSGHLHRVRCAVMRAIHRCIRSRGSRGSRDTMRVCEFIVMPDAPTVVEVFTPATQDYAVSYHVDGGPVQRHWVRLSAPSHPNDPIPAVIGAIRRARGGHCFHVRSCISLPAAPDDLRSSVAVHIEWTPSQKAT